MNFIPIKYGKRNYPDGIKVSIQEIAGHFDVKSIKPYMDYSLHTEYAYGGRKFSNSVVSQLETIKNSHKNSVPKLWLNEQWSREFCLFIKGIVDTHQPPKIIEIHPPFNDYCASIDKFTDVYRIFEEELISFFPDTEILIENRCGSTYAGGRFLISTVNDIRDLCEVVLRKKMKLRAVLDFPQLFSSYNLSPYRFSENNIKEVIRPLKELRDFIAGIHIWGKTKSTKGRIVSHCGNLDTYFISPMLKEVFMSELKEIFNDDKARYFVPEVNSNDKDLDSIVQDYIRNGFSFV
ncbi:MAG TPA: hypothetical protein VMW42_02375 [Desulfatiglandales bacterium]|nr:hypothetical protein [Desulfatiglandales bacterium]